MDENIMTPEENQVTETNNGNVNETSNNKGSRMRGLTLKLKELCWKLIGIFKEYPFTLGSLVICGFFMSLYNGFKGINSTVLTVSATLAFFALEAFFIEEWLRNRKIIQYILYIPSIIIAYFFKMLMFDEEASFFGMGYKKAQYVFGKYYMALIIVLACLIIYHICKRHEEGFEKYCIKTFFALLRTTVVYGIFAIGIAIIILIFNELIYDTDGFLGRLEIFLAAGIYSPAIVLALTDKKEDVGKFARGCVLYALEPLLAVSYLIIYIYIIKIFVTNDVPSNSVFVIMTLLFALGMPIWTMALGLEDNGIFGKMAKYLPFSYLPFIILQGWSIGVRIGECGVTTQRYYGVVLIVLELIYFGVYIYEYIKKKEYISFILPVIGVVAIVTLIVPVINYEDVSINSQLKRLSKFTVDESLIHSARASEVNSIYVTIREFDFKGEARLKEKYSEEQLNILSQCKNDKGTYSTSVYVSDSRDMLQLDISKYSKISEVDYYKDSLASSVEDFKYVNLFDTDAETGEGLYVVDLSDFVQGFTEKYDDDNAYSYSIEDEGIIRLDDNADLYICRVAIRFDKYNKEIERFEIRGYILEK